jgi:hypothetical protein
MKVIKMGIAIALTMATISAYALTTQEIVNQSLPSVVAIIVTNANTKESFEGTGWFITSNRIVTNTPT